jgi:L-alanine-DL-glutamate epimerase-like enolase superfamily enzyme
VAGGGPFWAAIETAAWDLEAAARGTGLATVLAGRLEVAPAGTVACGVALGIPEDRSLDTLRRRIA